jgi:hypothetical protein
MALFLIPDDLHLGLPASGTLPMLTNFPAFVGGTP